MKPLAPLALLSAALPLAACQIKWIPQDGGSKADALPTYAGEACNGFNKGHQQDVPNDQKLLDRVCKDRLGYIDLDAVHAAMTLEDRHRQFDDRHPDLFVAALNVIDCSDRCSPLATGVATYYAGLFDDASLGAAIEPLAVDADAKKTFVALAAATKARLEAKASQLDARRRHMYIEVVRDVVNARRAYFDAHAAEYAKLDALEKRAADARSQRKVPQDLVADFGALRAAYFASCADDACRFDPLPIELTRELVLTAAVGGDEMLARAENYLLSEPAAGRHLFHVETGTAVYEAMNEERHEWELYEHAKQSGVDDRALEARFGSVAPFEVDPSTDYIGSENLPDLTRMFDRGDDREARGSSGGFDAGGGIVAAVVPTAKKAKSGEPLAQVVFKDNVSSEDVESCYETGKVTGVHFDSDNHAQLEYETVCNTVGTKTNVEKVPPVLVPKSETTALKPGENLVALVAQGTHEGLVVRSTAVTKNDGDAKAKTPVLQVRGQRFGAKK